MQQSLTGVEILDPNKENIKNFLTAKGIEG